jgi:hypothetical protein
VAPGIAPGALPPGGWAVVKGQLAEGETVQANGAAPLEIQTKDIVPLPVEAAFRFRAAAGDSLIVRASEAVKDAKPLVEFGFYAQAGNRASLSAKASGAPMATEAMSSRTWTIWNKKGGSVLYGWRFPRVKNLWDERDYREIGAAYDRMTPFDEKVFTVRLALSAESRQIWIDDRLVAEERIDTAQPGVWSVQLTKTARLLSAALTPWTQKEGFLPLALDNYSHAKAAENTQPECAVLDLGPTPMRLPQGTAVDLDLGETLYRYRLTHGSGPDAGYVEAHCAWPGTFRLDPALLNFRVPYRNYQNVWLLAWVDDDRNAVPRGTLRFFREKAGYPASADFEISADAERRGLMTKLDRKTAGGKPLYLVKVPVDTEGLYGMRDMADQFLEFELSKPVALARSYPDPIYYGYHPSGPPSSLHVVAITLQEAPFGIQVEPKQTQFVFERPEKPVVTVTVTNTSTKALDARVSAQTTSYDGGEKTLVEGRAAAAPGKSGSVDLTLDLRKDGWHGLKVVVESGEFKRGAGLSLVILPPNTRTYGNAPNETRFGAWCLDGHYTASKAGDFAGNESYIALYRKLGLRYTSLHPSFVTVDLAKKYNQLPRGPHTIGGNFGRLTPGKAEDAEAYKKAVDKEVAAMTKHAKDFDTQTYFYGGEWGLSEKAQYAPWPFYTGDGDLPLDDDARRNAERHVKIFTDVGRAIREQCPKAKLILQWGAAPGTLAYLRAGMPRDLVDGFGMDAPMFELLPEISNVTGSINQLWLVRAEAKRLGWPRLPIAWCEGPFFPTNPGALTERAQADYQVRYLLLGLAYGVDQFESAIVPQDAGNYYGAEHYGAGLVHRTPLDNPKPAVAAMATMTSMLCGADPVGGVDTGCLTTYCFEFQRAKDKVYALWRVTGTVNARIKVRGTKATLTDAMGNASALPVRDGAIAVTLSPTPLWLTGVEKVESFAFDAPAYSDAPAKLSRPLVDMSADKWAYDGAEDKAYAHNHFAIRRITDPNLKAEFGQGEKDHPDAVAVTLPVEPGDRPLATRYGQLKLKTPVAIPGKAAALGLWIKGNSSWGRVVYQCRDAKGELWTSNGTKDDWNCDDTHAWSYVSFEGWRYVRFPLPASHPYDSARELEMTWWGCHGGDGVVDLPLTLERIFVEARNEVPVLGEMKLVPERSYKLSGLVAEYDAESDATDRPIVARQLRMPLPEWAGPAENPIARLAAAGVGDAPEIKEFVEPQHWNDGQRMHIRFDRNPQLKYNLYVSRHEDGRGADLLRAAVEDNQLVTGLRTKTRMYLFLTSVGVDKRESKPSRAFLLVTHDKFLEK